MVQVSIGLHPPSIIANMLGLWLNGIDVKLKKHIFIGASAMYWAVWLSRNDVVFDKSIVHSPM